MKFEQALNIVISILSLCSFIFQSPFHHFVSLDSEIDFGILLKIKFILIN